MKKLLKQFCRFSAVGVVAFLMDYGLLFVFTESLHMHYLLSSMLSFSVSTVFNYVYSTRYVFDCDQEKGRTGQFTVFLLLSVCGLLLNSLLMKIFVEQMMMHYMMAKLCAAILVSVWNFISRKVFLEENFRERISGKRRELLENR